MNISIEHFTKKIRGVAVLDDVSLELQGGYIYGLQGKNGCGKTMLMRAIAGLIRPTSGEIYINGKKLHRDMTLSESLGILLENPSFLPEYSGYKNLRMLAGLQGGVSGEEIRNLLQEVGLGDAGSKKFGKYSLGMKQRLGVAAAIMGKPEIIMLDEPINAIDGEGVEQMRQLILSLKDPGRIIIVACHDKEEMELLADKVVYLRDGKVASVDEADRKEG